ncbi:MAG: phosphatidylglycerol lysyltransferase domain-containing protein [Candidatus Bathyarchaeia archaeon]
MNISIELPEYPDAREIRLEDRDGLAALLLQSQPQISEYTFTNLYAWRKSKRVLLSKVDDAPIILRELDGRMHLMPALTALSISGVIGKLSMLGGPPPVYGLLKTEAELLKEYGYTVQPDRENWDYVYLTRDLIELSGAKFRAKRQNINRCLSEHRCEYVPIDGPVIGECTAFLDRWCRMRHCEEDFELEAEIAAIKETLIHYLDLPVFGAAIRVDGSVEAFAIGERLNNDTAVVHFEKANSEIRGLYQVVNNWFCSNRLREFTWVNREQDLGIPGLQRAKMEYNPHHFIEKYIATPPPG